MRRRSSEATRRQRGARRAVAPRVRGVVLLEVLIALAILILGMAAVGMQVNVGLRVANNSEIATRAVMLAQSKLAELDAGIVQLVPNEELEGDFGIQYPGWAWRMYVDQTDTPDLNMVTLQVLYKPGVAFREEVPDYNQMTIVHTSYTLRATPANMDLRRDFGFTEEQLQEASDSIPIPNFDPTNIDPGMIAQLDPEVLAEVLPKLMELLGSNAALLNTLPQATRDQVRQAMNQAGREGQAGGPGRRGQNEPNATREDQAGGAIPDAPEPPGAGRRRGADRLGANATGFDSPAGRNGRRPGADSGNGSGFQGGPLGSGNRRSDNTNGRDGSAGAGRLPAPDAGDGGPRPPRGNPRPGRGGNRNNNGAAPSPDVGGARDTGRAGGGRRGSTGAMDRGGPENVPPPGFERDSGRGGLGRRPSGFDGNTGGSPPRFGDQANTSGFGNFGGRPGSGFPGSRFSGRGGTSSGLPGSGGFGSQGGVRGGGRGANPGGFSPPGPRLQQPPGLSGEYQVPSERELYRRPGR